MPYNNAPIPPPTDVTGTARLPAEMFVQYLAQKAHTFAQTDRKPRRNIQYRDVANAVSRIDNLEFLADVVPRTMTYKHFRTVEAPSLREMWPARDSELTISPTVDGDDADPEAEKGGLDEQEEDDDVVDEGDAELEAEAEAEADGDLDPEDDDDDDDRDGLEAHSTGPKR